MSRAMPIIAGVVVCLALAIGDIFAQSPLPRSRAMALAPSGGAGPGQPQTPLTPTLSMFGDGRDGNLVITTPTTLNSPAAPVNASGQQVTVVGPYSPSFVSGDAVLFHQTQGSGNQGTYEFNILVTVGQSATLAWPLTYVYSSNGGAIAQMIKVPQYADVTLNAGLTAPAWGASAAAGGILVFLVNGMFSGSGGLSMSSTGFKGGSGNNPPGGCSQVACGNNVAHGGDSASSTGACPSGGLVGGNGGTHGPGMNDWGAGGGGGYGTTGGNGQGTYGGLGGAAFGLPDLSRIALGSGGGGGSWGTSPYGGGRCTPGEDSGRGGGIILVQARNVAGSNLGLNADGNFGGDSDLIRGYGGGGGSGGSIKLVGDTITLGGGSARGGAGGRGLGSGGTGGVGRIRVEYCTSYSGSTTPAASVQQITGCSALATPTPISTPTPTPILVGHVTWQGRPAQPNATNSLPLTLTLALNGTHYNYPNQVTDASGVFTVPIGALPTGVYTWWVKGLSWLATGGQVSLSGAPVTQQQMGLQPAGDVNNDNLVDITDFSLLRATFGLTCGQTGYDSRADFTGDCLVDITDFSLLRGNFGQVGPAPP